MSQACTAPEKNVKPSPRSAEASAHAQKAADEYHMARYSRVDAASVIVPSRYEIRRPRVSATTPVGTSNSTMPAVKNAFAPNASALLKPASSRNSVLMPQMKDAASVCRSSNSR